MIQIVDIDAARSKQTNNEALIKQMITETDTPIQVFGGIRTLNQINDWFESGAARVVLGTIAITDSASGDRSGKSPSWRDNCSSGYRVTATSLSTTGRRRPRLSRKTLFGNYWYRESQA